MRFVFLQHGSDPIVFLDRFLAWARLDRLTGDHVPDLSPEMRWIPVVTLSAWDRAWRWLCAAAGVAGEAVPDADAGQGETSMRAGAVTPAAVDVLARSGSRGDWT